MIDDEVTDWKGNVIKEGDEICFIKIKTGGLFTDISLVMLPGGEEIPIPAEEEKDCWEVEEYLKVERMDCGLLGYTRKYGEWTVTQAITMDEIKFFDTGRFILAIKGVSDTK